MFASIYTRVMQWAGHRHAPHYLAALSFAESPSFPTPSDTILAQIVSVVYTVERQTVLAKHARKLLCDIGFTNISFRLTDGSWGWSEEAPFDAILMTAAATTPPASLLDQLGSNGYLIGPLGQPDDQQLVIVRRKGAGFVQHIVEPARFVPLRPGLEN